MNPFPKIYWKGRSQEPPLAGWGLGDPGPLSFGWRHFRPTLASHWADFPSHFQFSPRVVTSWDPTKASAIQKPDIQSISYTPDRATWRILVEQILERIGKGEVEKVVLARECTIELKKTVDPLSIMAFLAPKAPNAALFCIQPTSRSAFLGASPERLFYRRGDFFETEALAGTRKWDSKEDLRLIDKERNEFSLVEKSIQQALAPFTAQTTFSKLSLRAAGSLQHLHSVLQTHIGAEVNDSTLLDRLHPTAALAGFPPLQALQLLDTIEPFERGLYGAPIGHMGSGSSEWIVAIRSCLLFGSTVRLYSGAGIVAGSQPDAEWDELDAKLGLYEGIFL